ncbi:hypothetical protein GHT06_013444 [Daphnia sinensis]|uniref:Endonuclease/exonuclease/phosphatase domain-containing protein n=1 Tax=Daphnia sinensis TaxID=1820382 RepID=A0AAD5PX04_9CRUS|nr:hypothetical protein GHT06_013444 [Daphnia sinensis]
MAPDHRSDSKICPAYLDLSAIIQFAIDNDITIIEARTKIDKAYSALDRLKADICKLQEELKNLKSETIEPIERKVEKLSTDTEHTNQRIDKFEETFTARFDKLKNLITSRFPSRPAEPQDGEDYYMDKNPAMPNITCIQWNSRGLTKARLEAFRHYLSLSNPSIVLICGTFWNNNYAVKFRSHNIINKNRADRHGGGVAILINKSIPYTQLNINNIETIEAVGVSIITPDLGTIDFISAYCPKGDCSKEKISTLIDRDNHFLIGGDFNAHHESWSRQTTPNKSGKSIYSALLQSPQATLITPHSLGTYINPSTSKTSTIDLMITTADIACDASISLGPYLGSDHLPWHERNAAIATNLNNKSLVVIDNPQEAYDLFSNTLIETSHSFFRITKPTHRINPEKSKPWWTTDCNTHVKETRRALADWRSDTFSTDKMLIWWKQEATKRKIIIKGKKKCLGKIYDQPQHKERTQGTMGLHQNDDRTQL